MTSLRFEDYVLPAAARGEDSALPDIYVNSYIRAEIRTSERIAGEDARYIGKGMISTLLPYRIADGYGRARTPRPMHAAVLENEAMRAVFLPEVGGRLWSLYDKRAGRELLYKNDVFQPANLALRNAWFSGGVEWNVGIKGHNPLTADPLFAARAKNTAGDDVLLMYEYERIRGVVFAVEATLAGDALLVQVTVENTAARPTPMYWWSNIAVPETPGTRVLAPAREVMFCAYSDGAYFLDKTEMPIIEGRDVTYALRSPRSRDFFYDIPKGQNKWIATANEAGEGLLHVSDPILGGRKLFVWGNHTGGRHWNEWLSDRAGAYIEIQAGLLKTQLEHFTMAAESTLTWRECYSAIALDPRVAHGDLSSAVAAADRVAEGRMPLLSPDYFTLTVTEAPTLYGAGWGALENRIRKTPISTRFVFPEDSISKEQADFVALLSGEGMPAHPADAPAPAFAVGEPWLSLLEARPERSFYEENHLGIMRYAAGDYAGAKAAFRASYAKVPNAWALRNLAMIEKNIDKDAVAAAEHILAAHALLPEYRPLTVECLECLLSAARPEEVVRVYGGLSPTLRAVGRIRMLLAAANARLGRFREAAEILTPALVVEDIKEGEYALSAIWTDIYRGILAAERGVPAAELTADEILTAYPLPRSLDFRMH